MFSSRRPISGNRVRFWSARLVRVEGDRTGCQVVHSSDHADGAGVDSLLQDRTLFADLLHREPDVLLADLVHVGVVLDASGPGSLDRGLDLGEQLGQVAEL